MNDKKEKEIKTADYTRRAVDNYHNKKDLFSLALRKGTKDAIRAKHGDIKLNDYFQALVDCDLAEKTKTEKPAPDQSEIITDDPANDPALIFENYNKN